MKLSELFLPYRLQRLADGSYHVLNRFYAPLGVEKRPQYMPPGVWLDGMSPMMAASLSCRGSSDMECIDLYHFDTDLSHEANAAANTPRLALFSQLIVLPSNKLCDPDASD